MPIAHAVSCKRCAELSLSCRALVVVGSPSTLQGSRGIWRDWLGWISHFKAHVDDTILPVCPYEPGQGNAATQTAKAQHLVQSTRSRPTLQQADSSSGLYGQPTDAKLAQQRQPATPQSQVERPLALKQEHTKPKRESQPEDSRSMNAAASLEDAGMSNGHPPSSRLAPDAASQQNLTSDAMVSNWVQMPDPKAQASAMPLAKRMRKRSPKQ